jgi:hypothetical protein
MGCRSRAGESSKAARGASARDADCPSKTGAASRDGERDSLSMEGVMLESRSVFWRGAGAGTATQRPGDRGIGLRSPSLRSMCWFYSCDKVWEVTESGARRH